MALFQTLDDKETEMTGDKESTEESAPEATPSKPVETSDEDEGDEGEGDEGEGVGPGVDDEDGPAPPPPARTAAGSLRSRRPSPKAPPSKKPPSNAPPLMSSF